MSVKAFTSIGYYHEELYDAVADYFVERMDKVKMEVQPCLKSLQASCSMFAACLQQAVAMPLLRVCLP